MAVSMASIWQKNGFMLANGYWRQCWSRRAVSGVTCHWSGLGSFRHWSTYWRISLMMVLVSYCCSAVEMLSGSGKRISVCFLASAPRRFFGLGTGVKKEERRRDSVMFLVG